MTLRHLKVFVAVCENGSVTKAADALHMVQPAVSTTIAELEKYLEEPDFWNDAARSSKIMQELKNLKALIYFTDGYGVYPAKMPPYETAFVFMKEDYQDIDVPPWAIRLILDEEDLTAGNA